jgi:hypothetical protein
MQKSKGYNGERWVAEWLNGLGLDSHRNYCSGSIKLDGLDCDVSSVLGKVEVKTWKKELPQYLMSALNQGDGFLIYLYARGRGYKYDPYVIMNRERFERLVKL